MDTKAADFETIAITHSKDKEELAYKLGADSVVADGKGLLEDQGHGADVLLDTSNSYIATVDSIKGLRPEGRRHTLDSNGVFAAHDVLRYIPNERNTHQ